MDSIIFKRYSRKFLNLAALVVAVGAVGFVSACGEVPKKDPDPEIAHCKEVLEKLTKNFTDIALVKSRGWDVETIKNVSLTFDYVIPALGTATPEESLRGLMLCRYEYSIETRTTKGREVKAIAVRFRGTPLSSGELILLNTSISGKKSRLKWPKKSSY